MASGQAFLRRLFWLWYNLDELRSPRRAGRRTHEGVQKKAYGRGFWGLKQMIRPLHPTDLPSYLSFARKACRGEGAINGLDDGASRRVLDFLSRSLPLETPRQTWVYTEGRNILGLVAVKNRPGTGAWEIDRLLGGDCPNAEDVLTRLLVHLSGIGGEDGVQKIFLRLPADSPWVTVARRAGFFAYAAERVYQVDARPPISAQNALLLRPRRPQDHLALFEHYNRVTPARVRQAEALTLQEWRWMDGWQPRRHFRFNLARGRRDYVWEEDGHVVGWLRFEARSRALRVTLDPEKSGGASADAALAFAVRSFQTPGVLFAPVRDYQPQWESALIRHGFSLAEEYTLLVRQLAVRVGEHCLVPVGV